MNAATLTFIPQAALAASESPNKTNSPDSASSTNSTGFSSMLSTQQQKHSSDSGSNNDATHSADSLTNNGVNAKNQQKNPKPKGDEQSSVENEGASNQQFVDAALFIASEAKALQSHKHDPNAVSLTHNAATPPHSSANKGEKNIQRNEANDAAAQRLSTTVPHAMHTVQHDATESLAAMSVNKTASSFDAAHTTQLNRGVIAAAAHELRPALRSNTNAANHKLSTEAVETLRRQPALAASKDFTDAKIGTTVRFQDEHHLQRALTQNLRHDTLNTTNLSELSAQSSAGITTPLSTNTGATALNATVNVPLTSPQWGQEFGRQMLNLTRNLSDGSYHAELRLDPPELGPLRISLKLSDSIAHAHIVSAHANVRSAVEQALPQLQQALSQAGLSLGEAGVSDQGMAQHFASQQDSNEENGALFAQVLHSDNAIAIDDLSTHNTDTKNARSDALIDTFA